MQFREIKAGATLYVYDRNTVELTMPKVVSVSAPHIEKAAVASMVVDVSTDSTTYTFKDTSDTGYTGNLIITADRSAMLKEVEAHRANDEAMLARVEAIKAELPKIETILDALNPAQKERKQNEERFTRLENSLGDLRELMEQLVKGKKGGAA